MPKLNKKLIRADKYAIPNENDNNPSVNGTVLSKGDINLVIQTIKDTKDPLLKRYQHMDILVCMPPEPEDDDVDAIGSVAYCNMYELMMESGQERSEALRVILHAFLFNFKKIEDIPYDIKKRDNILNKTISEWSLKSGSRLNVWINEKRYEISTV